MNGVEKPIAGPSILPTSPDKVLDPFGEQEPKLRHLLLTCRGSFKWRVQYDIRSKLGNVLSQ